MIKPETLAELERCGVDVKIRPLMQEEPGMIHGCYTVERKILYITPEAWHTDDSGELDRWALEVTKEAKK